MPGLATKKNWSEAKAIVVEGSEAAEMMRRIPTMQGWQVIPYGANVGGYGFDVVIVAIPIHTIERANWVQAQLRTRLMPGGQIIQTCRGEDAPATMADLLG